MISHSNISQPLDAETLTDGDLLNYKRSLRSELLELQREIEDLNNTKEVRANLKRERIRVNGKITEVERMIDQRARLRK